MNIIKSGPIEGPGFSVGFTTNQTGKSGVLIRATVMAPSIQVFLQASFLCCVVTTSIGGITDWQKAFSQLENKVMVSQEEIKSLHQKIEWLEKRLEPLEAKGDLGKVKIRTVNSPYTPCPTIRPLLNPIN